LNARQCHDGCGLRTKNEPLTTNATLRQTARTARTAQHDDTKPANARKTR
jgi:hypothetical protein